MAQNVYNKTYNIRVLRTRVLRSVTHAGTKDYNIFILEEPTDLF